jgi:chemosensory pili system protein ChpA (sensor histidine kinase/response regulator)
MADAKSDQKPMIVWVEDNRDYQGVVREWLLPRYDVVTYNDGESFLDEIQDMEPDLIMLDVRLPGPDGFKLCRNIRADKRLRGVPILFLTSSKDDETYIAHLDVGGTSFVTKPIDKKKLLTAVAELVDGARI